jgi:hypothetical protein
METNTIGYYLPRDVTDWIKDQAEKENRSASNYLATLIRRLMKEKANDVG